MQADTGQESNAPLQRYIEQLRAMEIDIEAMDTHAARIRRVLVLETGNEVMNTPKAAKLVVQNEAVPVSVEQFVEGPDQGVALIPGLLELLKSAVAEFQERLGMGEAPRVH